MSALIGALGGLGEAGVQVGMQNQKLLGEQALAQQQQDAVAAREQALARLKSSLDIDQANTLRTQMADRVNTAAGAIADKAVASKRSLIDSNIGDASTWTPEQQAAVDQSLASDRDAIATDPKTRRQAGESTGDISPEKAAVLSNSMELNQVKMDALLARAQDRSATMEKIADVRADAMRYGYELRLQAAQEKRANGKIDTATGRMLITSEDANIKASTSQLSMLNTQLQTIAPTKAGKPNPDYDSVKSQMDDLRHEIQQSKDNKTYYLKSYGLLGDVAAPPTEKDVKAATKDDAPAKKPAPYPEGTALNGPDGKRYVVKNGDPVLSQ